MSTRAPARHSPWWLAATLAAGCDSEGVVEIAWRLGDRNGEPIVPGALFAPGHADDSCDLPGRFATRELAYELAMELEYCIDDDCTTRRFSCATHRGSLTIAAAPDPYLFTLRPVVEPATGLTCGDPAPACLAVPGPRERRVLDGLVTDLQVYDVVLDVDTDASARARLDLEACGCS